jgi:hypothetical protein
MVMKLTKRRFLTRAAGATGGAIAAHFLGLFPELGVAQAASPGRPRGRELWGEEAERAFALVESNREAGQFRAHLASEGFTGKGVRQAVVVIAENGSELGHSLVTTLRANGRTARLVQNRMGSEVKSALATWSNGEPSFMTVYGGTNDQVQAIGTIRTQGMRIVVTEAGGREHVLDLSRTAAKSKAGALASIAGPAGSAESLTCDYICTTVTQLVCGLTCAYTFYTVCTIILLLSGLPGLFCFLASWGVCFVSCNWVTSQVCTQVCA